MHSHPKPLVVLCLPSLLALAQAQSWVDANSSPYRTRGATFDPARQRILALQWYPPATWSHDGARWRRHEPEELPDEGAVDLLLTDPVRGQAVCTVLDAGGGDLHRTYTSRGAGWQFVSQGLFAGPQRFAAGAFDRVGGRLVTFGGLDAQSVEVDSMFAWSGSAWVPLAPAVRPSPRSHAGMAADPVRQRVVLFGGRSGTAVLGDTWEWDGGTWLPAAPVVSPTPRSTRLAYDAALGEVVLVGGISLATVESDVWSWNGSRWQPVATLPSAGDYLPVEGGTSVRLVDVVDGALLQRVGSTFAPVGVPAQPPARSAVAYDPTRGELLAVASTVPGGTWGWNGARWQQRSTGDTGPRYGGVMAPLGSTMLVFGGGNGTALVGGTWSWNGAAWQALSPAIEPLPRYGHTMVETAFAGGNRVLLFGGTSGAPSVFGDTWTFDGAVWNQRQPGSAPAPRFDHGMAFDPVRQRVVLHGGQDHLQTFDDTWEWDGTNWLQHAPATVPQVAYPRLAYDAGRGGVAMVDLWRVWLWQGSDWSRVPMPCSPTCSRTRSSTTRAGNGS